MTPIEEPYIVKNCTISRFIPGKMPDDEKGRWV
jgi:hypothetical protein